MVVLIVQGIVPTEGQPVTLACFAVLPLDGPETAHSAMRISMLLSSVVYDQPNLVSIADSTMCRATAQRSTCVTTVFGSVVNSEISSEISSMIIRKSRSAWLAGSLQHGQYQY